MKMNKKMLFSMLLLVVLSVFALTGCTANGNQFMELNKEIAMLPQYSYTGDMTMSFNLPEVATAEMTAEDAAIIAQLKNLKFSLSGNYIAASMYQDFAMGYELNAKKGTLRFVMEKTEMYINADDLTAFVEAIGGDSAAEEVAAMKTAFNGVTWLKMDSLEGTEALGDSYNMLMKGFYNNLFAMQSDLFAYTDALNAASFAQYKPDIFSKSGNAYAFNITKENFKPVIKEYINYIIANKTAIVSDTKTFVQNNDLLWLTDMGFTKAELLTALDEIDTDLADVKAADLAELNSILDEGLTYFDGSSVYMSLEKRATNKYRERFDFNIAINAYGQEMAMRFNGMMDIDASAKVTPNIPTENVKTKTEIVNGLNPTGGTASIDAATGNTVWTRSYEASLFNDAGLSTITLKKVNGSYYLPLRQVGVLLGEDITWDQKAKKAYLVSNSQKYNLTGFIQNGTTYVKLREFEKAGYTVNWNAEKKEITITK